MRWLCLLWIAALLAACSPLGRQASVEPANVLAVTPSAENGSKGTSAEPEAVAESLSGTATLDAAAAQVAAALNVQPDQVRVRIQDSRCSVCNIELRAKLGSVEGLTVEEAGPLIEANATFWLFVDDLVCEYMLRDAVYTPQVCRIAP